MTQIFPFAVAVLLLAACAPPEKVFTSELDVRDGSIIERNMGYGEDTAAFLDSLVSANL